MHQDNPSGSSDRGSGTDETSDRDLVRRAREGDAAGFGALVRRHYRSALAVAFAILGRRDDAEDVCQDAWIRALEKLEDCRQPDRFVYWLLQIVRNRARNYRAYAKVRRAEPLDQVEVEDAADRHEQARLRGRLDEAIGTLTEIQREIVLLHDLEGWDHHSIGQGLGISETNSRQHLFQARRRLRALLGTREDQEVRYE